MKADSGRSRLGCTFSALPLLPLLLLRLPLLLFGCHSVCLEIATKQTLFNTFNPCAAHNRYRSNLRAPAVRSIASSHGIRTTARARSTFAIAHAP